MKNKADYSKYECPYSHLKKEVGHELHGPEGYENCYGVWCACGFQAPVFYLDPDELGLKLKKVDMQEGPILESGMNGCCNEDLINIVLARLEGFQASPYSCRENAIAITKLEEALLWLHRRTNKRKARGVEGTHTI